MHRALVIIDLFGERKSLGLCTNEYYREWLNRMIPLKQPWSRQETTCRRNDFRLEVPPGCWVVAGGSSGVCWIRTLPKVVAKFTVYDAPTGISKRQLALSGIIFIFRGFKLNSASSKVILIWQPFSGVPYKIEHPSPFFRDYLKLCSDRSLGILQWVLFTFIEEKKETWLRTLTLSVWMPQHRATRKVIEFSGGHSLEQGCYASWPILTLH